MQNLCGSNDVVFSDFVKTLYKEVLLRMKDFDIVSQELEIDLCQEIITASHNYFRQIKKDSNSIWS